MSFVKKAVKKVFKVVKKIKKKAWSFTKRVVKSDWFKIAAIIALSVFTAGIAAGGFAAFSGVSTVGGFFSAVGTTMSTGFTAITGAIAKAGSAMGSMFGGGSAAAGSTAATTAASTAAGTAATAGAAEAAVAGGLLADAGVGVAGIGVSGVSSGASMLAAAEATGLAAAGYGSGMAAALGTAGAGAAGAGGGFLGTIGGMLTSSTGKYLMGNAVLGGIQSYYADKRAEVQEGYYRNRNIWGNAAYGSDGNVMDIMMPSFKKTSNVVGGSQAGLLPYQTAQLSAQEKAAMQEPVSIDRSNLLGPGPDQQLPESPNPQQAGPGVPGQQTQPPPATQPQQGQPPPPPGTQLENLGY
jgi:hypothetical protein